MDEGKRWPIVRVISASAVGVFGTAWVFFQVYQQMGASSLLALAGCSLLLAYVAHKIRQRNRRRQIRVCLFDDYLSYLPIYVAVEQGFFVEEGLQVVLSRGAGNRVVMSNINDDSADIGVGDPGVVVADDERRTKVIGVVASAAAIWGVTTKDITPIMCGEDLRGKKLAVYTYPSTSRTILEILAKRADVEPRFEEMSPKTDVSHLQANEADVVIAMEPAITEAYRSNARAHIVFRGPSLFPNFPFSVLYCANRMIEERRVDVLAFLRAVSRAMRFMETNLPETIRSALPHFPSMNEEDITFAVSRMLVEGVFPKSPLMRASTWARYVDLCGLEPETHRIGFFVERFEKLDAQ